MTNQALAVVEAHPPTALLPTMDELTIMGTLARSVLGARGHAVPQHVDSAAKAFALMLAGHEVGLRPLTSLRHVYIVNGKTEFSAQALAGIVLAREPDAAFDLVTSSETECTMRLSRPRRGLRREYTHTIEMAKTADQLYSPGDSPGSPVVDLGSGVIADAATGEVLADAPAEVDRTDPIESNRSDEPGAEAAAEPFPQLPSSVRGYIEWASERYGLNEAQVFEVHGTTSVRELAARGLPDLISEIADYVRRRNAEPAAEEAR